MHERPIKLDDFFVGEGEEGAEEVQQTDADAKSGDFVLGVQGVTPHKPPSVESPDPSLSPAPEEIALYSEENSFSSDSLDDGSEADFSTADADFRSIGDLIDEELKDLGVEKNDAAAPSSAAPARLSHSGAKRPKAGEMSDAGDLVTNDMVAVIAPPGVDLGEGWQVMNSAVNLVNQINQQLAQVSALGSEASQREGLIASLKEGQGLLREQQSMMQDLVSSYIRQGDFERVGAVDKIKRHVDDLLLQIRARLNQMGSDQTALLTEAEIAAKLGVSQDLNMRRTEDGGVRRRKATNKQRAAAQAKNYSTPISKRIFASPLFKAFLILALFGMCIPAYQLSANWGVEKVAKIDIRPYKSVLPLESANSLGGSFHGVVSDSWRLLSKKEREQAVRDLAEAINEEGYKSIVLIYAGRGMAATYNFKTSQIHVQ